MLEETLKLAIHSHHGLLSKNVLLLHDNARPHSAAAAVTTIQKLKSEAINHHPPYSPVLTLPNYHVFGTLKKALHSSNEVKETSINFFFQLGYRILSKDVKSTLQRMTEKNILFGSVCMMCISV
jgi:hypothetical protein